MNTGRRETLIKLIHVARNQARTCSCGRASVWAMILGVPTDLVKESVGTCSEDISWPEIYDWLVESEVIKLPVSSESGESKPKRETAPPSLFD